MRTLNVLTLSLLAACSRSTGTHATIGDAGPQPSSSVLEKLGPPGDTGLNGAQAQEDSTDNAPRTIEWAKARYAREVERCRRVPPSPEYLAFKASIRSSRSGIGRDDGGSLAQDVDGGEPDELNAELKFCLDQAKTRLILDMRSSGFRSVEPMAAELPGEAPNKALARQPSSAVPLTAAG